MKPTRMSSTIDGPAIKVAAVAFNFALFMSTVLEPILIFRIIFISNHLFTKGPWHNVIFLVAGFQTFLSSNRKQNNADMRSKDRDSLSLNLNPYTNPVTSFIHLGFRVNVVFS